MFDSKQTKEIRHVLKSAYNANDLIRSRGDRVTYINDVQRVKLDAGALSPQDMEFLQSSLGNHAVLSLLRMSKQGNIGSHVPSTKMRVNRQNIITRSTVPQVSTVQQNLIMRATDPAHKLVAPTDRVKKGKRGVNEKIHDDLNKAIDKIKTLTGVDLGTNFGDTSRALTSAPKKAGAAVVSWHKTGRAIDLSQGSFNKGAIKKEASDKDMFFRIYLKYKEAKATEADLPKEDRHYIVKFDTVDKKEFSKSPKKSVWYVDVTAILEALGFERIKAQQGWEKSQTKMEWWHYEKRDNLMMYKALREIYTEAQIIEGYKKIYRTDKKKYKVRFLQEGFPSEVLDKMDTVAKSTKSKSVANPKEQKTKKPT